MIDTGVDPRSLAGTLYRASGPAAGDPGEAGPQAAAAESAFTSAYMAMQALRYDVVHNHAFDAPAVRLATALQAPAVHAHLPPDQAVASRWARWPGAARGRRWPPYQNCRPAPGAGSSGSTRSSRRTRPPRSSDGRGRLARVPCSRAASARRRAPPRRSTSPARRDCRSTCTATSTMRGIAANRSTRGETGRTWPSIRGCRGHRCRRAMARAAVVLCPSRWDEPFGLAAAEAQACGTPVVAFRRGGLE